MPADTMLAPAAPMTNATASDAGRGDAAIAAAGKTFAQRLVALDADDDAPVCVLGLGSLVLVLGESRADNIGQESQYEERQNLAHLKLL